MYAPLWSDADTVPHEYRELFLLDSIRLDYCPICGATWPLNQHHAVFRSAGECYDPQTGEPREKPTITLCGSGNASGCHGKAHHRMLHFKNVFHISRVHSSVYLRPQTVNSGTFAEIEDTALQSICVRRLAHFAAQSVNFPYEMTF